MPIFTLQAEKVICRHFLLLVRLGLDVARNKETFQKSSKGLGFFGGETIGYLDIAFAALLGPICVIEVFSLDKFVRQDITPGLIQWAVRFRAHEAVKPYMPTVEEITESRKQQFEVLLKQNFK